MYSDDILEFDVNNVIKNEIKTTIDSYKERLDKCNKDRIKLRREIEDLSKKLSEVDDVNFLITNLRDTYLNIKGDDRNIEFPKCRDYKRFFFIENIMKNFFNIPREYDYRLNDNHGFSLHINLAINYYHSKEILINLINIIDPSSIRIIKFVKNFTMPFDYNKEDVISYVKYPNSNTNGCIYGISDYWLEAEAKKGNLPHDLIMQNPYILDDDIFNILLDTIRNKRSNFHYLFALPSYNKNISDNHIKLLGECLIGLDDYILKYDVVSKFISTCLHRFNEKTLDFLFNKITNDNQYKTLHWENFPIEYQMRYLKSKPFEKVYSILTYYACKWSIEDKEKFFKDYFKD